MQVIHTSLKNQFTLSDHTHTVHDPLGNVEHVGGKEDGPSRIGMTCSPSHAQ